jgi:hypothetical protein
MSKTEREMKAHVVRLSLPIEAPNMTEAIRTFMDMANEGSWVFTVETPHGRFMVDTERDPETNLLQAMNIILVNPSSSEKA